VEAEFAEVEFVDVEGHRHTLVDRGYPSSVWSRWTVTASTQGSEIVAREILSPWHDPPGRELARITIERPDYVESTEKRSELVVFRTQLSRGP
jgi:hypothetical protein